VFLSLIQYLADAVKNWMLCCSEIALAGVASKAQCELVHELVELLKLLYFGSYVPDELGMSREFAILE
jgi:hypothetical protein